MIVILTLPVILLSVILYLALSLLGNNIIVWSGAFISGVILNFALLKGKIKSFRKVEKTLFIVHSQNHKRLSVDEADSGSIRTSRRLEQEDTTGVSPWSFIFLFLIIIYTFAQAVVISPLILTLKTGSFEHIQITDVGDYYKHIFVVTSLSQDGVPAQNPYFPPSKLSYYYGYYLIPASLTKIFSIPPNLSLYGFALFTNIIALLIFLVIVFDIFKNFYLRILSFLLIIFGSGMDVSAFVLYKLNFFTKIMSLSLSQGNEEGIQLINTYKAFLFVPQHFFASAVTIASIYYLYKKRNNWIFLGLSLSFVFLSSSFVSFTFWVWIFLLLIFIKEVRIVVIKALIFSIFILAPFAAQISDRNNPVYFYKFHFLNFFTGKNFIDVLANFLLTIFLSYGPVLLLIFFIFILSGGVLIKNNLMFSLVIFLPVFLTWFIRSPLFNDFSMRTMMPIQIALPIFFIKLLEQSKNILVKKIIIFISVLTIILGMTGFYFEYLSHWQNRSILHPRDSEVILKLRSLDPSIRLAAVDRQRWVEFIPSLGFKKVLSPYLFDSYNYISGGIGREHASYEEKALKLFINENKGKDIYKLVENENEILSSLKDFFNKYPADKLIINNQNWYKKDINPYLVIFKNLGVQSSNLTGDFTLFDYPDLQKKLDKFEISIDDKNPVIQKVIDNKFDLKKGVWFIASCAQEGNRQVKLEVEDYLLLFDQNSDGKNNCFGRLFYLESDEKIKVSNSSTAVEIYAFPLKIN